MIAHNDEPKESYHLTLVHLSSIELYSDSQLIVLVLQAVNLLFWLTLATLIIFGQKRQQILAKKTQKTVRYLPSAKQYTDKVSK